MLHKATFRLAQLLELDVIPGVSTESYNGCRQNLINQHRTATISHCVITCKGELLDDKLTLYGTVPTSLPNRVVSASIIRMFPQSGYRFDTHIWITTFAEKEMKKGDGHPVSPWYDLVYVRDSNFISHRIYQGCTIILTVSWLLRTAVKLIYLHTYVMNITNNY